MGNAESIKKQELKEIVRQALEWRRKYNYDMLSLYALDQNRADAWTNDRDPDCVRVSIGYRPEP